MRKEDEYTLLSVEADRLTGQWECAFGSHLLHSKIQVTEQEGFQGFHQKPLCPLPLSQRKIAQMGRCIGDGYLLPSAQEAQKPKIKVPADMGPSKGSLSPLSSSCFMWWKGKGYEIP